MTKNQRDIQSATSPTGTATWVITNRVVDRDFDCNAADTLVTSDVLGTLIEDLIAQGVIQGTVSSGA